MLQTGLYSKTDLPKPPHIPGNAYFDIAGNSQECLLKIKLKSILYNSQQNYSGWNFVISTFERHWVSDRIQLQHGLKTLVNRTIFENTIWGGINAIKHTPVNVVAHATYTEHDNIPFSIANNMYARGIGLPGENRSLFNGSTDYYKFHELLTLSEVGTQILLVFEYEARCHKLSALN